MVYILAAKACTIELVLIAYIHNPQMFNDANILSPHGACDGVGSNNGMHVVTISVKLM